MFCKRLSFWWGNTVVNQFLADGGVLKEAQDRNKQKGPQQVLSYLAAARPCLVAFFFAVMFVWLMVDINVSSFDGLVPGTKNKYVIDAQPYNSSSTDKMVTKATQEAYAWHRNPAAKSDESYSCMCSYSNTQGALAFGAPSAVLFPPGNVTIDEALMTMWHSCSVSRTPPLPAPDTYPPNSTVRQIIYQFHYEMGQIQLAPHATAVLMTEPAWTASRLAESRMLTAQAAIRAQAHIMALGPTVKYNNTAISGDEMNVALDQLLVLQSAWVTMFANLVLPDPSILPRKGNVEQIYDQENNTWIGTIECKGAGNVSALVYQLQNQCCYNESSERLMQGAECVNLTNCPRDKAYDAYIDWCSPSLCHHMHRKGSYLQVMQVLAALGGLWGLFTLLLVFVGWNSVLLGMFLCMPEKEKEKSDEASKAVAQEFACKDACVDTPAMRPPSIVCCG